MRQTGNKEATKNIRSNQYPQSLAHEEPTNKGRYIICIKFSKRPHSKPLETNSGPLPKVGSNLQQILSCWTARMRHRFCELSEELRVILVVACVRKVVFSINGVFFWRINL